MLPSNLEFKRKTFVQLLEITLKESLNELEEIQKPICAHVDVGQIKETETSNKIKQLNEQIYFLNKTFEIDDADKLKQYLSNNK